MVATLYGAPKPSSLPHGDASDTALWPAPADDPDLDGRGHVGEIEVAEKEPQYLLRSLFSLPVQYTIPSPNYSSRNGRAIRVLALHTGETGNADGDNGSAVNLAKYFATVAAQSSSHATLDDEAIVRTVPCAFAAWTMRGANSFAVQLEIATRAKRTAAQWRADPGMLERIAVWLAAESEEHDIPLRWLTKAQYFAGERGCMEHIDYTEWTGDGSHWDCGPGFRAIRDGVMARAIELRFGTTPIPIPPTEEDDMTPEDRAVMARIDSNLVQLCKTLPAPSVDQQRLINKVSVTDAVYDTSFRVNENVNKLRSISGAITNLSTRLLAAIKAIGK